MPAAARAAFFAQSAGTLRAADEARSSQETLTKCKSALTAKQLPRSIPGINLWHRCDKHQRHANSAPISTAPSGIAKQVRRTCGPLTQAELQEIDAKRRRKTPFRPLPVSQKNVECQSQGTVCPSLRRRDRRRSCLRALAALTYALDRNDSRVFVVCAPEKKISRGWRTLLPICIKEDVEQCIRKKGGGCSYQPALILESGAHQ